MTECKTEFDEPRTKFSWWNLLGMISLIIGLIGLTVMHWYLKNPNGVIITITGISLATLCEVKSLQEMIKQ